MPGPPLTYRIMKSWPDVHGADLWIDSYYDRSTYQQWSMGWHMAHTQTVFGPLVGRAVHHLIGHERRVNDIPMEGFVNEPKPAKTPPGEDLVPEAVVHWQWRLDDHGRWYYWEERFPGYALIDFFQYGATYWRSDYLATFGLSSRLSDVAHHAGWAHALGAEDLGQGTLNAGKGILAKGSWSYNTYKGAANRWSFPEIKGKGKDMIPKGKGPNSDQAKGEDKGKGKGKDKGPGKDKGKGKTEGKGPGKGSPKGKGPVAADDGEESDEMESSSWG